MQIKKQEENFTKKAQNNDFKNFNRYEKVKNSDITDKKWKNDKFEASQIQKTTPVEKKAAVEKRNLEED